MKTTMDLSTEYHLFNSQEIPIGPNALGLYILYIDPYMTSTYTISGETTYASIFCK